MLLLRDGVTVAPSGWSDVFGGCLLDEIISRGMEKVSFCLAFVFVSLSRCVCAICCLKTANQTKSEKREVYSTNAVE